MKAMVADDSIVVRRVLVRILKDSCGFDEVFEAENGTDALRILQRETVSLVLLDWKMPKKTGIEVLQQMRASGRKIPVIMVTSEADKDCVVTAINNGVNDYIVKPINASTVAQKINRIMNPESVEEAETS